MRHFKKFEILPLKYIDTHPHGELVSRVIADVDQFADGLFDGILHSFFTGAATILGTFCFMLSVNVKITFVVVLITPVSFFCGKLYRKAYLCHVQAAVRDTRGTDRAD